MREENMRFGAYIRAKRIKDPRELTLKDVSCVLGISLSLLSDIEQGRRKPFDSDRIERFSDYLHLAEVDRARLYDLAARETGEVPSDIEDTMMFSPIGDLARHALRLSNAGVMDEDDWREFIRRMEQKRGKQV